MVCFRILFFLFLLIAWTAPVYGDPSFSRLIVFGDSNTDSGAADEGSISDITGGVVNGPPNVGGRSCNGPVVVEYAAEMLGVPLENYSVAGAMTGARNIIVYALPDLYAAFPQVEFTGVLSQLALFEEELDGKKADKKALYVYWAGSNDLVGATSETLKEKTDTALDNMEAALTRLSELGARRILVASRTTRPDFSGENNLFGVAFNAAVRLRITELNESLRAKIRIFEAFDLNTHMVHNPDAYGFEEASALCIADPACSTDPVTAAGYAQWDGAHKTTRAHEFMAERLVAQANKMGKNRRRGDEDSDSDSDD